jgi:hypothetical protein
VSVFQLSPGITPELTDAFVIELPLALGTGYLVGRRAGFEFAFALNVLALGLVKFLTDYADPWDDLVSAAAVLGGGFWIPTMRGALNGRRLLRSSLAVAGLVFVVLGVVKLTDFYDPFDLLLADGVIVAGLALWVYRHGYPGSHPPDSSMPL